MKFDDAVYEDLVRWVDRRTAGAPISQRQFQRRMRIGFVAAGRAFDRAETEGLLDRQGSGWIKP